SADNHAVLIDKPPDDLALSLEQYVVHRMEAVLRLHLDVAFHRITPLAGPLFIHLYKFVIGDTLLLAGKADQFSVVKLDSECLRKCLPDTASVAAVHSIDCDNVFTHKQTSSSVSSAAAVQSLLSCAVLLHRICHCLYV